MPVTPLVVTTFQTVLDSHLVITGASSGIGRVTASELGSRFEAVTLLGRNAERHEAVLDEVERAGASVQLIECDLGSLRSVSDAAALIPGPIDVLVANAGVAGRRGVTDDGFELHFGVNHLAHHLLVTELAGRIRDRVVVVASHAHREADRLDRDDALGKTKSFTGFREYARSKLANVWFGRQAADRHAFAVHIVHPGVVATDIWRRIPQPFRALMTRRMIGPEEGATTSIWAATSDGLVSGEYYSNRGPSDLGPLALDDVAATRLWDWSEEWVAPFRRSQ